MDLDISKMLLDISNEKRKKKKEIQEQTNIKSGDRSLNSTEYKDAAEALASFKCIECAGYRIKEIDGYYVCLACGLKIESIIDAGQEWRNYNNDDSRGGDQSRCDMPTNELLPKSSMGGLVGWGGRETFTSKRVRNMSRWYSTTYKESSLMEIFNNITIIAMNSGLNQCVIEEAKYMFKRVSEVKAARRTKKDGMKAGAIALACKVKGCPRNSAEIAKICRMKNNKTLRRCIKGFEEIWNNIILKEKQDGKALGYSKKSQKQHLAAEGDSSSDDETNDDGSSTDAEADDNEDSSGNENEDEDEDSSGDEDESEDEKEDSEDEDTASNKDILINYAGKLHRFISALGLDDKVYQAGKKILEHVETNNYLDKHNPLSRIASILFYVIDRLQIKINKYQIIQTCNVSQVTIDKCYIKLMKYRTVLNKIDI
jgi:transcription initiation factor TFIIIB Brf1 subunit/transcription initiation factor TFIIB